MVVQNKKGTVTAFLLKAGAKKTREKKEIIGLGCNAFHFTFSAAVIYAPKVENYAP
jgi:hypothetical protein